MSYAEVGETPAAICGQPMLSDGPEAPEAPSPPTEAWGGFLRSPKKNLLRLVRVSFIGDFSLDPARKTS
ncbi:MAG: hypothetical protein HY721_01415 [Planctomycetes bacterium]|nr:hypothetical protein [Planctomycetota bacterium]